MHHHQPPLDDAASSEMREAVRRFYATADDRYTLTGRRFPASVVLGSTVVPAMERALAECENSAEPARTYIQGCVNQLKARQFNQARESALLAWLTASSVTLRADMETVAGVLLRLLQRIPQKHRRRVRELPVEELENSGYCLMCHRKAEAFDLENLQEQECTPGRRLSGSYCSHHKPFTRAGSGERCNPMYRRGLERLELFEAELRRSNAAIHGSPSTVDNLPGLFWNEIVAAVSWQPMSLPARQAQLRRLATLIVFTSNPMDDTRKSIFMLARSGSSIDDISERLNIPLARIKKELLRIDEWLPDEIRSLLSDQDSRHAALVQLWCSGVAQHRLRTSTTYRCL